MVRRSVVSINIGSSKTKISVGGFERGKLYIEKAFSIDTPTGSVNDGRLLKKEADISELGRSIAKALGDNKVKCKDAIVTIQSTLVIRRELDIPKVKPKDMENMIRYEIEQYLPIDLKEYVIEYRTMEGNQEGRSRVLIAALPKSIAEEYCNLLNAIKLEPKALDINSNSVSKLFGFKQSINNKEYDLKSTAAFIDLGCNSINITIVSKGYFQFSRILPSGGSELDAAIADLLGISEQAAESKKLQEVDLRFFSRESEVHILNQAVADILDKWLEDIQRVFQYYKTRNSNNDINQIYLFGGTSNMKGIAEYFEAAIGVTTQKIMMLDSIVFEKSLSDIGIESFINSFGAIIRK